MTRADRQSQWAGWVTTVLGMLWLAQFPLWQDGSYSRITHSKWMGMLILTGMTAAACGYMLYTLIAQGELKRQVRLNWLHAAALGYFWLVALSAFFGTWADYNNDAGQLVVFHGAKRYEGLITHGCYGMIFLCMSLTRVRLRYLLDAEACALLVFTVVAGLQYHEVNVLELFPAGTSIRTNYEFQGTIGNIDMVVGYLAVAMAAVLGGFAVMERPGVLWLISGLAAVLLVLMTEVQCGLIMLAALLFLLALLALRRPACRWRVLVILGGSLVMLSVRLLTGLPWLDGTEELLFPHALSWWKLIPALLGAALIGLAPVLRRWRGGALPLPAVCGIAAALVILAMLAVYFAPIPAGNGLWELQEILHGRLQDAFGSERIGIWRMTLEMSRDNLLWGTGPDTFLYAMEDHMYRTGQSLLQRFDNPHNIILGVLSGSGLPAAVLFVVLTLGAVAHGLIRAEKDVQVWPLLLAVICYMTQGMFTFSICLVTPMFWAALGMLTGQLSAQTDDSASWVEAGKDVVIHETNPELCVPPLGDGCDQAGDVRADRAGADRGASRADQLHRIDADQG